MQVPIAWTELPEVERVAEQLIEHYPEKFNGIEAPWIVGYMATNKEKPDKKKPWDILTTSEPQSLTNSKKYFFVTYQSEWEAHSEQARLTWVFAALYRIDREKAAEGKLRPADYKDQAIMVRTFGADWEDNPRLPDLLKDDVEFIEAPRIEE